jgi:UDP-N-acetyl-alpha-D-quinovosamine dehydrogenase
LYNAQLSGEGSISLSHVLVTGATGFVGSTLCAMLTQSGFRVRAAVRAGASPAAGRSSAVQTVPVGDIGPDTDWSGPLADVDLVIHAAARAHVLHDSPANEALYRQTNTAGTVRLATEAARLGVRRFVYLSSIKVNGEETAEHPFKATDEPHPLDPYGDSKWRAEQALLDLSRRSPLEVVIVRPPLVYGPGVRANFLRLMRWVEAGYPLPLGAVRNRRSLVSVWNLCDLLAHTLRAPAAANATWLVSDGEDLSTPELIRRLASAMRRPARLLPVPESMLRLVGGLTGRSGEVHRLCSSLQVDTEPTRARLGWSPPVSVEEGLSRTVTWFLNQAR